MVHNWIQCMPPLAGVFWEFWEFSALKLKLNISKRVFIPLWNAVCGNRLRQIWTSGKFAFGSSDWACWEVLGCFLGPVWAPIALLFGINARNSSAEVVVWSSHGPLLALKACKSCVVTVLTFLLQLFHPSPESLFVGPGTVISCQRQTQKNWKPLGVSLGIYISVAIHVRVWCKLRNR